KGLHSLGVRPGMLLGKSFFELLGDVPQAVDGVRRALAGESVTATVELFGFEFEAQYSPVRERDGSISGVVGVTTDITERRRAEQAARRADAASRTLVQQAPLGILRATPEGTFLSVNPALIEMLGYESEAELLARHLDRDVFKEPAARARYMSQMNEATGAVETQAVWRRKDGDPITVRLYGRSVRHEDGGRVECHEIFAEDGSERPAHRRHRARLQQSAHDHPRERRAALSRARPREPAGHRLGGSERAADGKPAAGFCAALHVDARAGAARPAGDRSRRGAAARLAGGHRAARLCRRGSP